MKSFPILIVSIPLIWSLSVQAQEVESNQHYLVGGTAVPTEELEAVGLETGCTATLISQTMVLTAAHCVCTGQSSPTGCTPTTIFTLVNVLPIDDPSTTLDESQTRINISILGDVRVHPNYTSNGWLSEDFAIIDLKRPVFEVAEGVKPIPIEVPNKRPKIGDPLTMVGFGRTGENCNSPPAGKRRLTMSLFEISTGNVTLRIGQRSMGACPGDSGGPALNESGNIVGVASSIPGNYDPTDLAYDWIYGIGQVRAETGRVSLLRVHELESGFGPPTDFLNAEIIVQLNTQSGRSLGLSLGDVGSNASRLVEFALLREAFNQNKRVRVEFVITGPTTGRLLRVIPKQ